MTQNGAWIIHLKVPKDTSAGLYHIDIAKPNTQTSQPLCVSASPLPRRQPYVSINNQSSPGFAPLDLAEQVSFPTNILCSHRSVSDSLLRKVRKESCLTCSVGVTSSYSIYAFSNSFCFLCTRCSKIMNTSIATKV